MIDSEFKVWLKTDTRIGVGVADSLVTYAEAKSCDRVALILDSGPKANPHVQRLLTSLEAAVDQLQVVETNEIEPTYAYLEEFRGHFDPDLDLLVGIGGGSTLDLTKAVSVLVTNPEPAIAYRGFDLVKTPGIPVVAIPTTAGTGSEVTPNAVFTDSEEQRKLGINSELYVPVLALLDPNFVASCPRSVVASSGMDALVHSVESFASKGATPASRVFSREAFRLVLRNLPVVLERPDDLEAWGAMQFGAYLGGAGLMNGGGGLTGALSYPLGVHFKVPHGVAGGIFLALVSRQNVASGASVYGGLADLLVEQAPRDETGRALAVCDALDEITVSAGMPRLSDLGVSKQDLDALAEETFQLSGAIEQNPVALTTADVRGILERAY